MTLDISLVKSTTHRALAQPKLYDSYYRDIIQSMTLPYTNYVLSTKSKFIQKHDPCIGTKLYGSYYRVKNDITECDLTIHKLCAMLKDNKFSFEFAMENMTLEFVSFRADKAS